MSSNRKSDIISENNEYANNPALVEVDSGGSLDSATEQKPGKRNRKESGIGILEFTPTMAGQDVTPANFDFKISKKQPQGLNSQSSVQSLKGKPSFHIQYFSDNRMDKFVDTNCKITSHYADSLDVFQTRPSSTLLYLHTYNKNNQKRNKTKEKHQEI